MINVFAAEPEGLQQAPHEIRMLAAGHQVAVREVGQEVAPRHEDHRVCPPEPDLGEQRVLDVDHVVVCAGQESVRSLYDELVERGASAHLIGGADVAAELDAKRAIKQGTEVVAAL